jgi:TctA family transporter
VQQRQVSWDDLHAEVCQQATAFGQRSIRSVMAPETAGAA